MDTRAWKMINYIIQLVPSDHIVLMINFLLSKQHTLEGFKYPFCKQSRVNNRSVRLAELAPWDGKGIKT